MIWPSAYKYFPELTEAVETDAYSLRPIEWTDRIPIMEWRNTQLDVLRQIEPLTSIDQDAYFSEIVKPQLSQQFPAQIMLGLHKESQLIGYGALVHIHWGDRRAEVSFLTSPTRHDPNTFEADWINYLSLLKPLATKLGLHKLTTETYALRTNLIPILESQGFVQEGFLREHHLIGDKFTDSMVHGLIL